MVGTSFTPAKNRFRSHGNRHYYLATEVTHPTQVPFRSAGYRGPTLRYCAKPRGVTAQEQNGDATGTATSSAFRDTEVPAGYVIYNVGDSVFFNDIRGMDQAPMDQLRQRLRPTCHDHAWTPTGELEVAMGFATGEIMSYNPLRKDQPLTQFSRGSFEATSAVTDIRWAPQRPGVFVAAHAHGTLLVYDTSRAATQTAETNGGDAGGGGSAGGCSGGGGESEEGATSSGRRSTTRRGGSFDRGRLSLWRSSPPEDRGRHQPGPVACWHICQSAIHQVAFSPDGRFLAMVGADGQLRVFDFASEHLLLTAKSYFAGLLCVAWSLDGCFLLTGGEDDLVSVWSFYERRLLARCQGHSSWVTSVAFDPYAPGAASKAWVRGEAANGTSEAEAVQPPGMRRLCFGSAGADTKLLLWEMDVMDPDLALAQAAQRGSPAGSMQGAPVTVSHAWGLRRGGPGERVVTPNGTITPRQSSLAAATSRIARLPSAASPKGAHERQFSVQASATVPMPAAVANGRGGDAPATRPGADEAVRQPSGHDIPAVPLSATPLLRPIGGVAAHAEPLSEVVFTPGAVLTCCLGGNFRLWVPRVPPGSASHQSPSQPLTFNLITVQTTAQNTITANTKHCYIDPALNLAVRNPRISY